MKLVECLERLPRHQVEILGDRLGLPQLPPESSVAAALVGARIVEPENLKRVVSGLSEDQLDALKLVVYHGGGQGVTVELCKHLVNQMAGKRRQHDPAALAHLQDCALVAVRTVEYRQRFFVPDELLGPLLSLLGRQLVEEVSLPRDTGLTAEAQQNDLLEDLHRFLAYIFKSPVPLTQQGQIFKRHLRALGQVLLTPQADEDEEAAPGQPLPFLGRYPEPLGFFLDYGLDRHLVQRLDGRLETTADLLEWLKSPPAEKRQDLFEYWQERYYYPDLQTFLSVMQSVGRRWVRLDRLMDELGPLIHPSQRASFLARVRHHLGLFLGPMGLFQMGRSTDHGAVCRLSPTGLALLSGNRLPEEPAPHTGFILQANFEVVVPRPVDLGTLWNLEVLADLVRADSALIYQISRQSVYRALKAGMTGEAILALLHRGSQTGVPQNVAFDVKDWARAYGQVYLQEVCLLRCATPMLAREIKASRRTARFILGELTPTDLVVDAEEYEALQAALVADGHLPRPGVERGRFSPPTPPPAAEPPAGATSGGRQHR